MEDEFYLCLFRECWVAEKSGTDLVFMYKQNLCWYECRQHETAGTVKKGDKGDRPWLFDCYKFFSCYTMQDTCVNIWLTVRYNIKIKGMC